MGGLTRSCLSAWRAVFVIVVKLLRKLSLADGQETDTLDALRDVADQNLAIFEFVSLIDVSEAMSHEMKIAN